VIRFVVTFLVLSATWLLWSGYFETKMLIFGLVSVLITMGISHRMDRFADSPREFRMGLRPLLYVPWLFWEIVKANIDVARIILNPKLPISPKLIRVPAHQKTDIGQVFYANSITLTPGTISLDVRDNQILVHALTEEAAAGVENNVMNDRVAALEGSG
jgi:multicomponent Na+:H+ antiporter subunit E